MRKTNLVGIYIFVCLITFTAKSQNIDSSLTNFYEKSPFEKIYIQFDNTRYTAGKIIWFKAYLQSGNEPSSISKNFYIDWYDDHGKLINATVSPILNGSTSGSYLIPEKYTGSSIQAIAYTKWMRNFDSVYFFKKNFQIISNTTKIEKDAADFPDISVQFLPESGISILNKQNVIAFKAVNQFGFPEVINGYIKNKEGDTISSFQSIHDGMGKFYYTPFSDETYIAEWKDIFGNTHQKELPKAENIGVNLIVEAGDSNRIFHIQRSETVPESLKKVTVIGQMNGEIVFRASANLSNKEVVSSNLPINKFESGILQLTVFDANKQPLCERILFVKNDRNFLKTSVHFDTLNTEKRGKNVIEIELKDTSTANLSLAITDAGLTETPDNTIISQLLLKGDLTGNVYNAAYYFSSNTDSVAYHLDLVMLTNGWRRFNWNSILNSPLPKLTFEKDASYLTLMGKLQEVKEEKIKQSGMINLILLSKDSSKFMMFVPLLADGSFSEKNVLFSDTAKIFYKLNGARLPAKSKLVLNTDFYRTDPERLSKIVKNNIDTIGLSKYQYLIDEQIRFEILKKNTTLKDITVYSKKKTKLEELDKKYASGLFTNDGIGFDLTNTSTGIMSVSDYLTGKVFYRMSLSGVSIGGGAPNYYVDEFLTPSENIQFLNLSDIAYIKFFPRFYGSFSNGSPAISIYTRKGSDINNTSKQMDYINVSGYSPVKEFYSPIYAEKETAYSITPDLRATLLWSPWVYLDKKNNKIKIIFYNNDVTHAFRLILEGMDNEGKLLHYSKLIQY